ncbi:hypothetical protein BTO04_06985 [Polaribacter sp. SA4-10]|uniref:hypothetical protein n=1 Tax=Polaribacter sp. SA4-10 TaxID=754397 RepID=UPI000B3CCB63|nr:hypothetical protein [Polaribacter sp. SA4-10]ARV06457.1 hypothetical protein BTO04_06985 [Polaribacter sp. SA4-10]
MQAKWYISTLFLLLIYFGAFQEQVSIPNQEIILEFVDYKINKKDIENTIAEVKEKLLKVGVANIVIKKTKKGTLKISYYSAVHIDNVKEVLVEKNQLVLNQNSENNQKNNNSSNYNIDIHELTDETDISNSDYKFVFEIKYNSDRLTTVNYFALVKKSEQYKTDQLYKIAYKINKNNPFTKDRTSYKEPEVRAGPKYYIS